MASVTSDCMVSIYATKTIPHTVIRKQLDVWRLKMTANLQRPQLNHAWLHSRCVLFSTGKLCRSVHMNGTNTRISLKCTVAQQPQSSHQHTITAIVVHTPTVISRPRMPHASPLITTSMLVASCIISSMVASPFTLKLAMMDSTWKVHSD